MPELPEVDAIAGVVRRHARGNSIVGIEVVRWNGRYFADPTGPRSLCFDSQWTGEPVRVRDVTRVGKFVVMDLPHPDPSLWDSYIVVHNAMTGYFDWGHEPWTFDYVEGARVPGESDVRVRIRFADGLVLRFHDVRLFGSMSVCGELPQTGPELLETPNMRPGRPVIDLRQFAERVLRDRRPIKVLLMDQAFLAGIGNIYANEACHLAGVDPRQPANRVHPALIPVLLEALRCAVLHSIPQVTYSWLNVYRRSACGSCGRPVLRVELAGRATFICERCQRP